MNSKNTEPKGIATCWPLFAALAVFIGAIFVAAAAVMSLMDGKIIYALDDPYIHMAIAKNIALHGVYGVTPYGFSASSSSPLWTFLLAGVYLMFGVNEVAPGILNIVFAVLCVVLAFFILRSVDIRGLHSFVWLLLFIFFTPLPALVSTGMEHTLQLLLSIGVLCLAGGVIDGKDSTAWKTALFIAGALCVATRYEAVFLIFAISLNLAVNKKIKLSVLFFVFSLIPIILLGVFQMAHGWYFIPNSVFIKGCTTTMASLGTGLLDKLYYAMHLLALVFIAGFFQLMGGLKKERFLASSKQVWLFCFIIASVLHCFFASTGWFFRYEAYLVGLGVLAIGMNWSGAMKGNNNDISSEQSPFPRAMKRGFVFFSNFYIPISFNQKVCGFLYTYPQSI